MRLPLLPLCLFCWLAACSSTDLEVIPFRAGHQPTTIAVLPLAAPDLPPELRAALDDNAHLELYARGYDVVPVDVATTMLVSLGASLDRPFDGEILKKLRAENHIDAALVRRGKGQREYGGDPLQAFVVRWDVIDTYSGQTIWSATQNGGNQRQRREVVHGDSPYADDPLLSDEPMVQRSTSTFVTDMQPLSVQEIAHQVQFELSRRMPAYVAPPASADSEAGAESKAGAEAPSQD